MRVMNLQWKVNNQTRNHTAQAEGEITIGRKTDCDVTIPHRTVSRHHAVIVTENEILLRNLSQTNPIRINNQRVLAAGQETRLDNGDVFRLGDVRVKFLVADLDVNINFKIKCTTCGKIAEGSMSDCPWCGTSLAFGETYIATRD